MKCPCKGAILVVLGAIGLLSYFNVVALPYLELIWPVVAIIIGVLSFTGFCCWRDTQRKNEN
jgi:O-antigen/teichoic acid export membrane protein